MSLVEIKDLNVLIYNRSFFDEIIKNNKKNNNNNKRMKNLSKC